MVFEKEVNLNGQVNHNKAIDKESGYVVEVLFNAVGETAVKLTINAESSAQMKLFSAAGETYVYASEKDDSFIPIIRAGLEAIGYREPEFRSLPGTYVNSEYSPSIRSKY